MLDILANPTGVTLSSNLVMTESSGSLSKQAPTQTINQPILPMVKTVHQVEVDPGRPWPMICC